MVKNYNQWLFSELGIGNYSISEVVESGSGASMNAGLGSDSGSSASMNSGLGSDSGSGASMNANTSTGSSYTDSSADGQQALLNDNLSAINYMDEDLSIPWDAKLINDYLSQAPANAGYNSVILSNIVNPSETNFPSPGTPIFKVPLNPLLPKDYQEILSYDALQYINGFLRTQIGRYVMIEQFVGTDQKQDIYGYLIGVGINYILLQGENKEVTLIDIYTVKNVTFFFEIEPIKF